MLLELEFGCAVSLGLTHDCVAIGRVLLEEAAQLSPTDAELALKLAELLAGLEGGLEKAALYAERAVALDEENKAFRKSAALIYRKAGDSQKARKHLQRAWELDPMDKEIRQALQTL